MSIENVKKFYNVLKGDQDAAERFTLAMESAKLNSMEEGFDFVTKFAAEKGYDFSVADLKAAEESARELSVEELDNVNAAGGFCWIIGFGTPSSEKESCHVCNKVGAGFGFM